ncbi:MAG: hypothetical protein JWR44_600 [Hymenobacter sp.]|jgi:hypothetical protein|nr:hypothetical protein [Hymenobacter sp.]
MVWDKTPGGGSNQVYLSWSVNRGSGSTGSTLISTAVNNFPAYLSDPDVTMAFFNGGLYASVVYLAQDATVAPANATVQTYLDVYKWTGTSFVRLSSFNGGNPMPLGIAFIPAAGGLPSSNRIHSSANIDANAAGKVGIVWQETTTELAEIRVISPSYPGPTGYSFNQATTFAESYVLDCNIDGSGFILGCSPLARGALATRATGFFTTANNPPILFNQSLSPDVAVSPNGVLSFCYIGASANPTSVPVTSGTRLVLKQYSRDCNTFNSSFGTYSWDASGTSGVPRIAATPHPGDPYGLDVEIVMAWNSGACLENIGSRSYYEIRNWGRSAGTYRPLPTTVSLPLVATDNGYPALTPVVAFSSGQGTTYTDEYVVAWAGLNYPKYSDSYDVWSTTLIAGVVQNANSYSRANYDLAGNQNIPSVAGRYSGTPKSMAYLFNDTNVPQLSYRYSPVQAGNGALNRTAPGGTNAGGSSGPTRVLDAYPNPSASAVEFNLHLRRGETVQQLTVVDLLGRVLDEVSIPAGQAAESVINWQPKQALPTGSYVVKLVTNQRTENITIDRQP